MGKLVGMLLVMFVASIIYAGTCYKGVNPYAEPTIAELIEQQTEHYLECDLIEDDAKAWDCYHDKQEEPMQCPSVDELNAHEWTCKTDEECHEEYYQAFGADDVTCEYED